MPPESFLIRDANLADIQAILAIYRFEVENGVATFEDVAPSEEEMSARMSKILDAGLPYIVAERDGQVLGYAYAGAFHTRSAYRYTLEDTIYISPDGQRQGIGRAMLGHLIARAEALGCRQMLAVITHRPASPSVALHTAMGFRIMGVAQAIGFKFGRWLDVAYMQRRIGAGDSQAPDRLVVGPIVDA
jgi:phosphinothricin acetyltransferase